MPSTGGEIDLPTDSLDSLAAVDLAQAELMLKPERGQANTAAHPTHLPSSSKQSNLVVVHNIPANGSPLTVATAVLFLGLLILGSGLTLWHRRLD
jgi:hypothetical protein